MTRRLIAVGVDRSPQSDAAAEWAGAWARPGQDAVHVVHAVDLLALDGCAWPPALRVNETRRAEGHRVVAAAIAGLRSAHRGLDVDGSAIAGAPGLVLAEMAQVVDLLVVGAPTVHPVEDEAVHRHVGRRLSGHAACPVVVCPAQDKTPRDELPVGVLVDASDLPSAALGLAADLAVERGVALLVVVPWTPRCSTAPEPGEDVALWESRMQERLGLELADLQEHRPGLGVGVELRQEDARGALASCADGVAVLVVPREGLGTHRDELLPPTALNRPPCPVLVVPPAHAPTAATRHAAERRAHAARRAPVGAW